jgi:hypothetical protein
VFDDRLVAGGVRRIESEAVSYQVLFKQRHEFQG